MKPHYTYKNQDQWIQDLYKEFPQLVKLGVMEDILALDLLYENFEGDVDYDGVKWNIEDIRHIIEVAICNHETNKRLEIV